MSPESERRGPGTPSGLDVVRLRLADDGLVIAPGGS